MSDLIRQLLVLTAASSLAIIVVLLLRRLVQRAFGAVAAYLTWLMVPVTMIAVMLPDLPAAAGAAIGASLHIEPVAVVSHAIDKSLARATSEVAGVNVSAWMFSVWCFGASLCFLYFAGLQRSFLRGLGKLSGSRDVLRAQASEGCPALIGVFAPKVVLPRDFATRFSRLERRLVLAHERAHLRRRDTLSNALVALFRCAFWFNPLVHIAAGYFRLDQELACDAAVMERHPGSRRVYAGAMLKAQAANVALPVGCHWQSANQFKERLEMLKRSAPSRGRRIGGCGFVALAAVVVGYSAWAAEPGVADVSASDTAASTGSAYTPGRSSFVLNVGDMVLTFDDVEGKGKFKIATGVGTVTTTRDTAGRPSSIVFSDRVEFSSASVRPTRITIGGAPAGSPPDIVTAQYFVIEGQVAIVDTHQEGMFLMSFQKGCTVKLTLSPGRERWLEGPVCRIEGHS
jgi:beta-lactamase regulating signal transducer with metallopeptidase domain